MTGHDFAESQCPCLGCSRRRDEHVAAGNSPLAVLLSEDFQREQAIANADLVNLRRLIERPVPLIELIDFEGKTYAIKRPTFTLPKFTMPTENTPRVVRKVRSIHSRKHVSPCAMRRRAKILKERTDYAKRADDLIFRVMNIMESKIMCQSSAMLSLGAF